MILQFKIKNFRSYKEETIFSLEANSSDQKLENVLAKKVGKQNLKILKASIIYGANASGKSNILRALFELTHLILNKPKIEESLRIYIPFLFDSNNTEKPSEFELTFVGPSDIKFKYKIVVQKKIILEEELYYYPNGKITKVFIREKYNKDSIVQKGVLGEAIGKKEINVFANQLLLSKFGDDEPHEMLTEVFLYFKTYEIINATNADHKGYINRKVSEDLYDNQNLRKRLAKLIKAADTKINDIDIHRLKDEQIDSLNDDVKRIINKNPYVVFGIHDLYKKDKIIGEEVLQFEEESTGTQSLYILGGKILRTLESGGVLVVDELDNSLHPFITKMIVMIFQSKKLNKKNAQLIFTTHDVSLLDRDLIRRDQIWLSEKNHQGATDLYSLQDFDVREDTPFEKWYLAGKFGGLPKIKSIDSIFEENEPQLS